MRRAAGLGTFDKLKGIFVADLGPGTKARTRGGRVEVSSPVLDSEFFPVDWKVLLKALRTKPPKKPKGKKALARWSKKMEAWKTPDQLIEEHLKSVLAKAKAYFKKKGKKRVHYRMQCGEHLSKQTFSGEAAAQAEFQRYMSTYGGRHGKAHPRYWAYGFQAETLKGQKNRRSMLAYLAALERRKEDKRKKRIELRSKPKKGRNK